MNYLAHAVLSGRDHQVMAGNLLADQIKGELPVDLPDRVAVGVWLHRKLDAFTDNHIVFKRSRSRIAGQFGHYSGIVVDVIYDYFLAQHMERFAGQTLAEFVAWADDGFTTCTTLIPNRMKPRWTGLLWLKEYAAETGVERAFQRIAYRARRHVDFGDVMDGIRPELDGLEVDFLEFFPTAITAEKQFLSALD
ncbi:hypothetical protein BVX99_01855 [bacterium F16]|nr:hypothetical protein BVX99_01855 [bacterium F16]